MVLTLSKLLDFLTLLGRVLYLRRICLVDGLLEVIQWNISRLGRFRGPSGPSAGNVDTRDEERAPRTNDQQVQRRTVPECCTRAVFERGQYSEERAVWIRSNVGTRKRLAQRGRTRRLRAVNIQSRRRPDPSYARDGLEYFAHLSSRTASWPPGIGALVPIDRGPGFGSGPSGKRWLGGTLRRCQ
jgi:hypothetical protein